MIRKALWTLVVACLALCGIVFYLANPLSLFPYGFTLVNGALALFAIRADPDRILNRVFGWMSFAIALWGADLVFLHVAPNVEIAQGWVGVARLGLLAVPATIFHFGVTLTGRNRGRLRHVVRLNYFVTGVFAVLSVAGLLGSGIEWRESRGMWVPEANIAYTAWIYFTLVTIPGSVLQVLVAWWGETSPRLRTRYKIFLISMAITFLLASTNLIAPLGFDAFRHGYLGGVVFFVAFGYGIVRYRWLDLQLIIRRALVYTSLSAGIAGVYAASVLLVSALIQSSGETQSFIGVGVTVTVIAFAFVPARNAIQGFIDRFFFGAAYSDRLELLKIGERIARQVGIEAVARSTLAAVEETLRPAGVSLVVHAPPPEGDPVLFSSGSAAAPIQGREEDRLLIDLGRRAPLVIGHEDWQDLVSLIPDMNERDRTRLTGILSDRGLELVVPLMGHEQVVGVLCVGPKKSEKPFREEEVQGLSNLALQAAAAIENSTLFEKNLAMQRYNENILRSMDNGLITLDATGKIVTVNPKAVELLRESEEALLDRSFSAALQRLPAFVEFTKECLEAREGIGRREITIDHGERTFVVHSSLLETDRDRPPGTLLLFADVTEVKAIERQLEQKRRLAQLGELASQIAHEIRNPIASMKLLTESAPDRMQDPEFIKTLMSIVPTEIERLDRLVQDLLDFARPSRLIKVPLNPAEIIESTLAVMQEDIRTTGISVTRNLQETPTRIEADGEKLKQILLNLIRNSIQAMERTKDRTLTVGVVRENGQVQMQIEDTGTGMDQKALDSLFIPFFTTKSGGTGLGLSIVHRIIEAHGWGIEVSSKPGAGTRFTIACPAVSEKT